MSQVEPQVEDGLTSGSVLRTLEGLDDALVEPMLCSVIALVTIFLFVITRLKVRSLV